MTCIQWNDLTERDWLGFPPTAQKLRGVSQTETWHPLTHYFTLVSVYEIDFEINTYQKTYSLILINVYWPYFPPFICSDTRRLQTRNTSSLSPWLFPSYYTRSSNSMWTTHLKYIYLVCVCAVNPESDPIHVFDNQSIKKIGASGGFVYF